SLKGKKVMRFFYSITNTIRQGILLALSALPQWQHPHQLAIYIAKIECGIAILRYSCLLRLFFLHVLAPFSFFFLFFCLANFSLFFLFFFLDFTSLFFLPVQQFY